MPKVSIIIPAHNPGVYLREALRSVYAQTFNDWELIVVDDNSSEDLSWVSVEFPRAELFRQQHGGASIARNLGILNTTGELISFMDQDDLWRPHKLERQVDAMSANPDAALCHCDLEFINGEDIVESGSQDTAGEPLPHIVLDGSAPREPGADSKLLLSLRYFAKTFAVPSTVMLRRKSLSVSGLLDPFIPFLGDYDLIIKIGARHKVIRKPTADVLYRRHANNFSRQIGVRAREIEALTERYLSYARSQGDTGVLKEARILFGSPRQLRGTYAFDRARMHLRERKYIALARQWTNSLYFTPRYTMWSTLKWALMRPLGHRAK